MARYGGEEFALLLPETPRASALIVAERCRRGIEGSDFKTREGEAVPLTASMGVAAHPHEKGAELDEMIRLADEALYKAKKGGRNRVEVENRPDTGRSVSSQRAASA